MILFPFELIVLFLPINEVTRLADYDEYVNAQTMMSEKRSSVDEDILARFVCTDAGSVVDGRGMFF